MNILRILITISMVTITLTSTVSCRHFNRSLTLPAAPTLPEKRNPYHYSMAEYNDDIKVYEDNAPVVADATKQALAKGARNDIAWGLMGLVDDVYNVYAAHLYGGKGAIAVSGDAASLGLTAAAAIARLPSAKTLFGALGTAVTGVNLSVDKNYFAQQTYQVIALAMETRRTSLYTQMSNALSSKDVVQYPLTAVKRDLVLYLYAGSLPGGLQEIQKEAGTASAGTESKSKPAGAFTSP
jgi:hypothetical protein